MEWNDERRNEIYKYLFLISSNFILLLPNLFTPIEHNFSCFLRLPEMLRENKNHNNQCYHQNYPHLQISPPFL